MLQERTYGWGYLEVIFKLMPFFLVCQIMFARESNERLRDVAHAAIVIQRYWRGRNTRKNNSLHVLDAFSKCIVKVRAPTNRRSLVDDLKYDSFLGISNYI